MRFRALYVLFAGLFCMPLDVFAEQKGTILSVDIGATRVKAALIPYP